MSKEIKALLIIFSGLIFFIALVYCATAFVQVEINAFKWDKHLREGMAFLMICYLAFTPVMFLVLKDKLKP